MSKAEFKEIHLSDEKPHHNRRRQDKNRDDTGDKSSESDHDYYRNRLHNFVRKKRAALPLRIDW